MFGTFRTVLALMVVATHLGHIPGGGFAVFGFYILSGYLMTLIMQRNYGYTVSGVSKYAVNRFLRIYPIYWLSIVFSAVLVWHLGREFISDYHRSIYFPEDLYELAKNLLIFFPFREPPRLTPPAWALTVELFFYVLIGLGVSRNKRTTLIWFVVSVIYHLAAIIFQLGFTHRYFTIFAASLPFATGAMIFHYKYEFTQSINRVKGRFGYYLPYILFIFFLANLVLGYFAQSWGFFFYSNYILCAFLVAVLSERKTLPYISKKFDRWMGDFSYPIYLIHMQIGLVVVVVCHAIGIELKRPNLVLMFISIPLIFLCSWIITVVIERPIELLRTKIKS